MLYGRVDWIFKTDNMEINLINKASVPTNNGAYTTVNGGDGVDAVDFNTSQVSTNFKLTKIGAVTSLMDNRGIYPELRLINVEKINFSDKVINIQ